MNSVDVKEGQKVENNQVIGEVGNTGKSTGPHAHVEVGKSENLDEYRNNKKDTRIDVRSIDDLDVFINGEKKTDKDSTGSFSSTEQDATKVTTKNENH